MCGKIRLHAVGLWSMTTIVLVAIGFLSCWFLLYVLMQWVQDAQHKPINRCGADSKSDEKALRKQPGVISFRKRTATGRERCL